MKVLCHPRTSSELAVVESLLTAEKLPYFVHNEHFGGLEIGPSIPLLNERAVLVDDEDFERATALVAAPPLQAEARERGSSVPVLSKVRMVLEVLLLGWLLPAQRRRRDGGSE